MKLAKTITMAGLCVVLGLTTCGIVMAQDNNGGGGGRGGRGGGGGGNFDPAQMQARILDRATTDLGLKPEEATIIVPKIEKVLSSRFSSFDDMRTLRDGLRDLLQDPKSSDKAVKQQLDKIKALNAQLKKSSEAAEADLKAVLSVRQEAQLTEAGIINGGAGGGGFGGRGGRGGPGGGGGRGGNPPNN
jgi:hypothetical protein